MRTPGGPLRHVSLDTDAREKVWSADFVHGLAQCTTAVNEAALLGTTVTHVVSTLFRLAGASEYMDGHSPDQRSSLARVRGSEEMAPALAAESKDGRLDGAEGSNDECADLVKRQSVGA